MSTKTRRHQKSWKPGGMDPAIHNERAALNRAFRHFSRAARSATLAMRRASRAFDLVFFPGVRR